MKTKKILIVLLALFAITACHDEYLADKAYSIITEDNFFQTANDAVTAVNSVYDALSADGMYQRDMLWLNEFPTECVTTRLAVGESDTRWDIWMYQMGDFSGIYSGNYRLIERANQVIANVPKVDMLESLKNRIIGEATFLRALAYFNLVRVYGGVPLKLEPTTNFQKLSFPRATASEVYNQIITDLTWVYQSAGIPKYSEYAPADRGRVARSAVQALLGKVYLTRASDSQLAQNGDYQKAVEYLTACVNEGDRALVPNYANLFSMTNEYNQEVIFNIEFIRKSGLGGNLTAFLPTSVTQELYQISYYNYLASLDFYKSFDENDTRRPVTFYDRMTVKISNVDVVVYFDPNTDPNVGSWRRADDDSLVPRSIVNADVPGFRKFVDTDKTARQNAEEPNYFILRYSDVLLMLAEALNEVNNGPNTEAYKYLNMVRRRAYGLPVDAPDATVDYAGLNKQSFKEAVYDERRKEFVIECQNWFDGKRFWEIFTREVANESRGANPNLNNRPKVEIDLGRIRQDQYKLMPFSESQLDLNNELVQNPGY